MGNAQAAPEVWPPDWHDIPATKRRLARGFILALSESSRHEFCSIAAAPHVIPEAAWRFEDYHAAAAAAVQEDIKLNKIIYKLVPRHLDESEFWRLYFSQVLHVLQSVKLHGTYPPPPPLPTRAPGKAGARRAEALIAAQAEQDSSCAIM